MIPTLCFISLAVLLLYVGGLLASWLYRDDPSCNGDPERDSLGLPAKGHIVQCMDCQTVRRADGTWSPVAASVLKHLPVSHGLCPGCYWLRMESLDNELMDRRRDAWKLRAVTEGKKV
ncbi:MAG: hypothetical protein ACYDH9_08085 [Limisphaerales bacterium]